MNILIFRTNIEKAALPKLRLLLNSIPEIRKWSIDFNDCDKILRIVSSPSSIYISAEFIQTLLQQAGYTCIYLDPSGKDR